MILPRGPDKPLCTDHRPKITRDRPIQSSFFTFMMISFLTKSTFVLCVNRNLHIKEDD